MKRIILFLITNLAVVLVLSIVLRLLGLDRVVQANGIDVPSLLVFSFVVGFVGAIISLLLSKSMAKWSTGAQVIETPRDEAEAWLFDTIRKLAQTAGVAMPEIAVYEGAPNTFVIFFARIAGYIVDRTVFRTERGIGPGYYITVLVCQIVFGILASVVVAYFSRRREFRADAGSAKLLGSPRLMIREIARMGG